MGRTLVTSSVCRRERFVNVGARVVKQYPSYRLDGGKVMVQEYEGGRWTTLDGEVVNAMLSVFDGLSLDAMRNTILAAGEVTQPSVLRRVA